MASLDPTDNTIVVDNGHVGMDASTNNNDGNGKAPIKKKAHKKRKAQKVGPTKYAQLLIWLDTVCRNSKNPKET